VLIGISANTPSKGVLWTRHNTAGRFPLDRGVLLKFGKKQSSMKTRIKILSLLLLLPALGMAQQSHIDSLRVRLKTARADSTRFAILIDLGWSYSETNRDTALYLHDQAFKLAKKNERPLAEASALDGKGYVLMYLGKFPESLQCFQQSLKLADDPQSENKSWHAHALGLGKFTPHKNRLDNLAYIHHNLGHLMGSTNNIDQQIAEYRVTRQLAMEVEDNNLLSLVNMNLGAVYDGLNRLDSALVLEHNAERIMKQTGYKTYLGGVYGITGTIYLKKGNAIRALQYFHKTINTGAEQKNISEVSYGYRDLTNYYLSQKQKDSSLHYAKKTLETLKFMGSKALDDAYENLYKSYKLAGNSDSAYKYQGLALIAKDSSFKTTVKSLADFQKLSFQAQIHAQELEKEKEATQTRTRTEVLIGGIGVFMLLSGLFYRNNRKEKKAKNLLQDKNKVIEQTLNHLKSTQTQLIQSEKMASLGELTAGIAHEIQNPLNFVNNFSEVNSEMIDELESELKSGNVDEALAIAAEIKGNELKINHHGKRADSIVKGMLQHSKASSGQKEPTNINALADEYMRLAYHGLRAKDKTFNAELTTYFDKNLPKINVIPQDIGRVLLNLFNNAFYAVHQKQKTAGADYKPEVTVTTLTENGQVVIKVKDNGIGIPDAIKEKIMQPFFTTKPTGEGTGLGLSLSYEIVVKGHGGSISVDSAGGDGSEFIIVLPIKSNS
jgi:two-component system NtrC family sensor kinase